MPNIAGVGDVAGLLRWSGLAALDPQGHATTGGMPRTDWRSRISALSGLLALSMCARSAPVATPPGEVGLDLALRAAKGGSELAPISVGSPRSTVEDEWVEAVRTQRWQDARRLIDALGAEQREQPEMRYVRARVALALNDHVHAVALLDRLDQELPVLGNEIAYYRAEGLLHAGPPAEAARFFSAKKDPMSLAKAARAFDSAGELERASAAIARAFAELKKAKKPDRRSEAKLRRQRAELYEKLDRKTLAGLDWYWLATELPTAEQAEQADVRFEQLGKQPRLTKKQRLERAREFSRQGWIERTESELTRLAEAPGAAVSAGELSSVRAWAYYLSRRDYRRAAELFEQAAVQGSQLPVRDRYFAARAHSRSGEDELALKLYADLAQRYPRSGYDEQARYYRARLLYILGRWNDAEQAYNELFKRYGEKGRFAKPARYERAVSLLAAEKYAHAERELLTLTKIEHSDVWEKARFDELHAVALAKNGKKKEAVERFRAVIAERPLSFAALASAARLAELGAADAAPIVTKPAGRTPAPLQPILPTKVQLLRSIGLDADAERELELNEAALRSAHAGRGDEALCRAYGRLAGAARRYRIGQRAASWEVLDQALTPANEWLWDCVYPRPYQSLVRTLEAEYALPSDITYAVMRQESGFRTDARSPAQASGLMQLIPPTAEQVAAELNVAFEPRDVQSIAVNIRFGTYYLSKLFEMFGGNATLATAAYNAGPLAVSRWLESAEALPLDIFVARIPYDETRGYVSRVLGNYARYAYLRGGLSAVPKLELELPRGLRASKDAY